MSVEARVEELLEPGETLLGIGEQSFLVAVVDSGLRDAGRKQTWGSWETVPVAFTDRRILRLGVPVETGQQREGEDVVTFEDRVQAIPWSGVRSFAVLPLKSGDFRFEAAPWLHRSIRARGDQLAQPEGGPVELKKIQLRLERGDFGTEEARDRMARLGARYGMAREAELAARRRAWNGRSNALYLLGCSGCLTVLAGVALVPTVGFLLRALRKAAAADMGEAGSALTTALAQAPCGATVCLVAGLFVAVVLGGQVNALRADRALVQALDEIEALRAEGEKT